jgi:hypothetical protein
MVGWHFRLRVHGEHSPYLFDSTEFTLEFGFAGTPYREGIRIAAGSDKRKRKADELVETVKPPRR